jgi:hypothetical protein
MTAQNSLDVLRDNWKNQWPNHEPFGYEVRRLNPRHWSRFHYRKGTRVPKSMSERESAARFVLELISGMAMSEKYESTELVAVIVCESALSDGSYVKRELVPREVEDALTEWGRRQPDQELEYLLCAGLIGIGSLALSKLISSVVQGKQSSVVLGPEDFRWLIAPYDSGVDVVASSVTVKSEISRRFESYLVIN